MNKTSISFFLGLSLLTSAFLSHADTDLSDDNKAKLKTACSKICNTKTDSIKPQNDTEPEF